MTKKSGEAYKIDIVILWVDGNDQEWQKQKNHYLAQQPNEGDVILSGSDRYRDWGMLRYIFRGIETFAPWVNHVFLVTNGQKPEWLNEKAEGFRLVTHDEFIPKENLPTFSSQAIDLNLWRIPDLAEHFIYLNDDTFFTHKVDPEDFFHKGLPRDMFSERPICSGVPVTQCNMINNICALGRHYNRRQVLKKNWRKILDVRYGLVFFYNLMWYFFPFKKFCGLWMHHLPTSHLKSQWKRTWEMNEDVCTRTVGHRFRTVNDVNQYIYNEDRLMSGEFYPIAMQRQGVSLNITGDNTDFLCRTIESGKWKRLCLNDYCDEDKADETSSALIRSFEKLLPKKSRFEK